MCSIAVALSFVATGAMATPIRVLAIGDSITWGVVSHPTGPAYVASLSELLGPGYQVTNIGCGGSNASVWRPAAAAVPCLGRNANLPLGYFDDLVDPNTPSEIATIMLGTNDAAISSPAWIYLASLIEVANGLLERGVDVVVLMTPPPNPGAGPSARELLVQYARGIADPATGLCALLDGVVCGPNVLELLDPAADFQSLDPHPNGAGHAKIANALFRTIVAIPEPCSALLVGAGLGALAARRRPRPPGAHGPVAGG